MSDWRSRLALGAGLAVLAGVLFTAAYEGFSRRAVRNPSDAALIARFRAHRSELERELARRMGADSVIYLPHSPWVARSRFADVKGYAYSSRPLADLVEDLDAMAPGARRAGEVRRWHRPLENGWYLYREVGRRR